MFVCLKTQVGLHRGPIVASVVAVSSSHVYLGIRWVYCSKEWSAIESTAQSQSLHLQRSFCTYKIRWEQSNWEVLVLLSSRKRICLWKHVGFRINEKWKWNGETEKGGGRLALYLKCSSSPRWKFVMFQMHIQFPYLSFLHFNSTLTDMRHSTINMTWYPFVGSIYLRLVRVRVSWCFEVVSLLRHQRFIKREPRHDWLIIVIIASYITP